MYDNFLIWDHENNKVCAAKAHFKSEEEFIKTVKRKFNNKCAVTNVKLESCISTANGVEKNTLTPLNETDFIIENYYVAEFKEEQ